MNNLLKRPEGVIVEFTKKSGEVVKRRYTTNWKEAAKDHSFKAPSGQHKSSSDGKKTLLTVWDLEKRGFRTLNLEDVKSVHEYKPNELNPDGTSAET